MPRPSDKPAATIAILMAIGQPFDLLGVTLMAAPLFHPLALEVVVSNSLSVNE